MKFDEDKENSFARSGSTIFGAIFMSNRNTKKECLKRKLFGLPPSQANFVKKIEAGMPLFLFEYEERKLYGVFQATSDGAMNIVPSAFRSSGKQVPAQVLFKTIWYCHPLSEHDFCDAIKDNYYTAKKFNLGLSKDQVYKLLWLFNSRKIKIQKSQHLMSGGPMKQSRNLDLGRVSDEGRFMTIDRAKNQHCMGYEPLNMNEYSDLSRSNLYRSGDSEEGRFLTTDRSENQFSMGYELVNMTRYSGLSRSSLNHSGDSDKLILETGSSIAEGQHRLSLIAPNSLEPQLTNLIHSKSHKDMGNEPVNTRCNPYSSKPPSFRYKYPCTIGMDYKTSAEEFVAHSKSSVDLFFPFSRNQMIPSHVDPENISVSPVRSYGMDVNTNLGDYIPLTSLDHFEPSSNKNLFSETLYSKNKDIESTNLEGYRGLSFPEPSVVTMPSSRDANFGSNFPSFAFSPGNGSSHVLDRRFSSASKCEFDCEGPLYSNYEPSTTTISMSSEGLSQLEVGGYPLASRSIGLYEGLGQDDPTDFDEDYLTHVGLHSDNQKKRTSVFSRLTVVQEATVQDDDAYLGNKYDTNMSVNQLMDKLCHSQNNLGRTTKKSKLFMERHYDGDHFENITQIDMGEGTDLASKEEKCSDEKTEEIPVVNFKRRSKTRKIEGEIETEGGAEDVYSDRFSGTARKRRKLLRPSFSNKESPSDKAFISESSPNVLGSSQGINEGKENSGNEEAFVRSGDEGNKNGLSFNKGVQNGTCLVGFDGINEKTDKNANNNKGSSQELAGNTDCSLNMQCSSQGTLGCEGDNGKAEVIKGILNEGSPDVHGSSQGTNAGKGNSESDKEIIRSDGDEGNEKGSTSNEGVQNVICAIGFENCNLKTEKNANSKKASSQDLFDSRNCSLTVQCSSQGTLCCEGDKGKSEVIKKILSESCPDVHELSQGINAAKGNSGSDKVFVTCDGDEANKKGSSCNKGVQNVIFPIGFEGSNEKAEKNGNSVKGSQELSGIRDCSLNKQCSSQGTLGCEDGNGKTEEGLQ